MSRIHLVLLWHMHQPQYRDPETGRYVLPWTRLHALKDYWGMVHMLEEFPRVHATFNVVPSLGVQLEEYAGGRFAEPWFDLAHRPAEGLAGEEKAEILARAFQLNRENLMARWPRYVELYEWSLRNDTMNPLVSLAARDWRDLQVLSQLAWMDEEWLARDPVVSELASKGRDFSEKDKERLRAKQLELMGLVLPAYRAAAQTGQVELSTTPFYHPILPLLCDSDIARVANPSTPLPRRAYRHPEDAREQLVRARAFHERVFGQAPTGLWPSEGSVSDQALALAAELGFRWFATDEGVLGRTLNMSFARDSSDVPANAERLYAALHWQGHPRSPARNSCSASTPERLHRWQTTGSRVPRQAPALDRKRNLLTATIPLAPGQIPVREKRGRGPVARAHLPGGGRGAAEAVCWDWPHARYRCRRAAEESGDKTALSKAQSGPARPLPGTPEAPAPLVPVAWPSIAPCLSRRNRGPCWPTHSRPGRAPAILRPSTPVEKAPAGRANRARLATPRDSSCHSAATIHTAPRTAASAPSGFRGSPGTRAPEFRPFLPRPTPPRDDVPDRTRAPRTARRHTPRAVPRVKEPR